MKQISILIIAACLSGCFGAEPQKTGKEGLPMPEFSLLLTDSTTWLKSSSIPSGKPTVLLYFTPYCPYCKALTEEIVDEMDELKNIQFYFISSFPIQKLKAFYKQHNFDKYSNITVGRDTSKVGSEYFNIQGVPYLAIYGKDKKLNKTFIGEIGSYQLKKVAED